jgi:hypothetical protein
MNLRRPHFALLVLTLLGALAASSIPQQPAPAPAQDKPAAVAAVKVTDLGNVVATEYPNGDIVVSHKPGAMHPVVSTDCPAYYMCFWAGGTFVDPHSFWGTSPGNCYKLNVNSLVYEKVKSLWNRELFDGMIVYDWYNCTGPAMYLYPGLKLTYSQLSYLGWLNRIGSFRNDG